MSKHQVMIPALNFNRYLQLADQALKKKKVRRKRRKKLLGSFIGRRGSLG